MRHTSYKIFLLMVWAICSCQTEKDSAEGLLETLMENEPSKFRYILDQRDSLEVQILYTQINRDSANYPSFKSYYFNLDSPRYFYPASTIKLPLVVLSLEKLNQLDINGLDKFTPVYHDSVYYGQRSIRVDLTSENQLPSIAHYVRKVLMVSDNDASNALYEFMGQRAANDQLRKKGYNIRILHRLSRSATAEQNRHTEQLRFVLHDTLIYRQEMLVNPDSIRPNRVVLKGTGTRLIWRGTAAPRPTWPSCRSCRSQKVLTWFRNFECASRRSKPRERTTCSVLASRGARVSGRNERCSFHPAN